ncbi:PQQ-binding-like beta-propeller repeat protein [Anatilimnocola sp. NA78]|uniref:outer membrane protein assembly factor BamB family protein n=1 Tax=Anatilimnocola sp. NA78 TaxID=3415683 RepID=UPI003CE4B635
MIVRYPATLLFTLALIGQLGPAVQGADTWPGFRGHGDSHSTAMSLPATWEQRGRGNGNWNIRLPGYGQASPVVWKDRIFVSAVSGDEKEHLHLLAISLADGKTLWQQDYAGTQRVKDSDAVSRGAPTPVVDAERVYFLFESGDVFALTHAGKLLWQRSFVKDYGEIKGPHGFSSSPVLADNKLIVQVTHGGPSYILALDCRSGENCWKVDHPSQTGWSTPAVIVRDGKTQVVVSTSGSVRALDARDGAELWLMNEVQGNSTASPTIAGDLVVIGASAEAGGGGRRTGGASAGGSEAAAPARPAPNPALAGSIAIRLGGTGDVSVSHLAWRSSKASAGYASPLVHEGRVYFVNRVGVAQCVALADGSIQWSERLPAACWASPIASDGRVFFFCKEGSVAVYQAADTAQLLGENSISTTDVVYGVAAVDRSWLVRTGRGLICIHNDQ